jgi:hypothetical protein
MNSYCSKASRALPKQIKKPQTPLWVCLPTAAFVAFILSPSTRYAK